MRLFLGSFVTVNNFSDIQHNFSMLHAKWTPQQNMHLTYIFLGEAQPEEIIEKLKNIRYERKRILLAGIGTFGKPPRILFTHAEDTVITALQEELTKRLNIENGQPYIPHVTLARIKHIENKEKLNAMLEKYKNRTLGSFELQLYLVQSKLTPKGAQYSIVHSF